MLESIAAGAKTGATIVGYGALLAFGFWGARKVTDVADEAIIAYRIRRSMAKDAKKAEAANTPPPVTTEPALELETAAA
jgi:hypothetical protein